MSSEGDDDRRSMTEDSLGYSGQEAPDTPPPEIMTWLQQQQRQRQHERIREFGHVRPMTWADWEGSRFVVVGSRIYRGNNWRTFPDFLHRYCFLLLGRDWHTRERENPQHTWHPLFSGIRTFAISTVGFPPT